MILKGLIDTDSINYKKICMVVEFPTCDFKCDKECGQQVCQNCTLATAPNIEIDIGKLVVRYCNSSISQSLCCQGLEPFDSWESLKTLIHAIRAVGIKDDIVIYTGYTKCEIADKVEWLKKFSNIIIKFGRYIPNQKPHYDEMLGVDLASDNQYAERIS